MIFWNGIFFTKLEDSQLTLLLLERLKITASQFVAKFVRQEIVQGIEVIEDLFLTSTDIPSHRLGTVKNCKFLKIEISGNFDSLLIDECEIETLVLGKSHLDRLYIKQSLITQTVISNGANVNNLNIENASIQSIDISNSSVQIIKFKHTDFNNVKIHNILNNNSIVISCMVTDSHCAEMVLISGKVGSLTCESIVLKQLFLDSVTVKSFTFNALTIEDNIEIRSVSSSVSLLFQSITSKGVFSFIDTVPHLNFTGGSYNELIFANENSTVSISASHDGQLRKRCAIKRCNLSQIKRISGISITETDIECLLLNNVNSIDNFFLNDVSVSNTLSLERTTISDGKFYNVDLSEACIKFINSTLSGSQIINVRWPRAYRFYEYKKENRTKPTKEKLIVLWALKESYRQMKVLSLAQHNKIDALYFQKQELNIFWRITKIKTFHDSFFQNVGNWFILATNKFFSDFGQNIWRPLVSLSTVHFIVFNFLLIVKFDIYPSLCSYDTKLTGEVVNAYFVTILPTHNSLLTIGNFEEVYIGGWIDFFMRIFSGYFIFYFVYSSRKFHQ